MEPTLALVAGTLVAAVFGAVGRWVCPPAERVPWAEITADDLALTVRRGWSVLSSHDRLERMIEEMRR